MTNTRLIAIPASRRLQRIAADLVGPYAIAQGEEAIALQKSLRLNPEDARSFLYRQSQGRYTEIWSSPSRNPEPLSAITLVYEV